MNKIALLETNCKKAPFISFCPDTWWCATGKNLLEENHETDTLGNGFGTGHMAAIEGLIIHTWALLLL